MFVMYCINGASRSSLLIESTDSMIIQAIIIFCDAGERNFGYALLMTTNKPKEYIALQSSHFFLFLRHMIASN